MLLQEEQNVIQWLFQYGPLPKAQVIRLLHNKPPNTAEKIIRNLKKEHQITETDIGYLGLDSRTNPDQRLIQAIWVLLKFVDKVAPQAHYPASYPSQLFFLKENIGYEIAVLYDDEQYLTRLLQPQDSMKYILVVPHVSMIPTLFLPNAPCLFATLDFDGKVEPDVTFYTGKEDNSE